MKRKLIAIPMIRVLLSFNLSPIIVYAYEVNTYLPSSEEMSKETNEDSSSEEKIEYRFIIFVF